MAEERMAENRRSVRCRLVYSGELNAIMEKNKWDETDMYAHMHLVKRRRERWQSKVLEY